MMLLTSTIHLVPDMTFFPCLGIFLLVLLILNFLVFRPSIRILDKRRELTDVKKALAQEFETEAEINYEEIRHKTELAREKGAKLREDIRRNALVTAQMLIEEGERSKAEILAKGAQERERYTEESLKEIESSIPVITEEIVSYSMLEGGEDRS